MKILISTMLVAVEAKSTHGHLRRAGVNSRMAWRRIATRYGRCATTFLSAVALAATVIFWL